MALGPGVTKDVSHYAIFQSDDAQRVSEPGAIVLFALGLLMLGFARPARVRR